MCSTHHTLPLVSMEFTNIYLNKHVCNQSQFGVIEYSNIFCTLGLHRVSSRPAVHAVIHVSKEEHQKEDHGFSVFL